MPYFLLLRPYAWIKNLFIFVPIFFARSVFNTEKLALLCISFVVFSCIASSVYIINDLIDKERDQTHDKKKLRPIASGAITATEAVIILLSLVGSGFTLGFMYVPQILPYVLAYLILNIAYSLHLKHIAIIDIVVISVFYLIRLVVGGVTNDVYVSDWLILCTIFITLFLIIGKRIAEFNQKINRRVLNDYTGEFLHGIMLISATLSIISYSLYVVLVLQSKYAVYSVFFVILGIMRYTYVVITTHKSEYPEHVILKDKTILASIIAWIILMCVIFYH